MAMVIKLLLLMMLLAAVMAKFDDIVGDVQEKRARNGKGKGKGKGNGKGTEKSRQNTKRNEELLNGLTAETTHLPLMLKCDDSFKTILLGSITVNSKEIDTKLLKSAQEECKRTQQRLSVGPPKERLRCSLELADAKNLTGDEHFRVVYQCYNDLPNKWEEETFKTASEKKAGKYVKMKGSRKVIFKISSVDINGAKANTTKFPELEFGAIERECYMQNIKAMPEISQGKKKYGCKILNRPEYGGTLQIEYWGDTPPIEEQLLNL